MRGLWKLTWIEIKIFLREPLGALGTVFVPVIVFVAMGKLGTKLFQPSELNASRAFRIDVPVFAALLIAINACLSLVSIISIYREGGILKRLRATPLRPQTILTAHVLVKLILSAITLALTLLAGKRYYVGGANIHAVGFTVALLISVCSVLSIGFLIASIVPTARFAQPIGSVILYPMIALSGLFVPLTSMPPGMRWIARALPLTYCVSLLQGVWKGDSWSAHSGDVMMLAFVFVLCTALSSKVFRWE
jgi:ABC-2 type transport system permease protein